MSRLSNFLVFMAGLSICIAAPVYAQSADETKAKDTILILDASGSMWGQIDGVNKIVIAKDVVEGLVRSLPAEQRLGLVAYGHRKKGDCSDIETLADVGAERENVIKKIRGLSPKGKTPLTKSVEHAAKKLNYTKKAATVILVSDGLENCAADPCALAKTLEENGLDFTVHVVGFDVTAQERKGLQCIAEETGGTFLAADNADELNEALTEMAMVEPPKAAPVAAPLPVALKATLLKGGPDIQSEVNWKITKAGSDEVVFSKDNIGYADTELPAGDYIAEAVWTGWPHKGERIGGDKTGHVEFTVTGVRATIVTVPIDLGIPVSFETDSEIAEGQSVNITWSGPDDLGVKISTNALDDSPRDHIYFTAGQKARDGFEKEANKAGTDIDTNNDGTFNQDDLAKTQIGGPSIAGDYEVRYTLNKPLIILARRPLKVTDSQYTVEAPNSVPAGSKFEVKWTGPFKDGDFVTIIEKDSETVFSNGRTARLKEGKPATLTAFAKPGEYEVRYILTNGYTTYPGMQKSVQAIAPITVTDVSATLDAPDTAVGGSTISVTFTPVAGDEWKDDYISVIEIGAAKYNRDSWVNFTRGKPENGKINIRVPAIEGDYELAYYLNPGDTILARQPIKITQAKASVDAPDSVKAGTDFQVKYSGDAFKGDRIIICPEDTPDNKMWGWSANYGFFAKDGETTGTVRGGYKATKKPGKYEARYVTGLQHQVIARDKFTVTE